MTGIMEVTQFTTTPFNDQNPGTSGLRKKSVVFEKPNYAENFIQSIFNYISQSYNLKLDKYVLVVGGDGRYLCDKIAQTIIQMAAANNICKVIIGQNSLVSTPAVSHIIRKYGAQGGIILTASHNPGGPNGDFGMKFNSENGGSAVESATKAIYGISTQITSYYKCPDLIVPLENCGTFEYTIKHTDSTTQFIVEVIDPIKDYILYMKEIFDFDGIRQLVKNGFDGSGLHIKLDCLNGVTGPYASEIIKELEACSQYLSNIVPKNDFGGCHPDPNLTYACDLVHEMKTNSLFDIGAAFDGDGDRYMILGKNAFFVNPSDCIAVVVANACECIPYFRKDGKLKGVARSMPTSGALEIVANQMDTPFYETPTGWKFFGNLMDAGKLSICGEESFGLGSDHIREKDGIWAFLCWISIMAYKKLPLDVIVRKHWDKYGRNFYLRYDYEELSVEIAEKIYEHLRSFISSNPQNKEMEPNFVVKDGIDFTYKDPVDGSISKNQGLIIEFGNGCKFTLRKSGTGSLGLTLRLYFEKYVTDPNLFDMDTEEILKPLIEVSLKLCNVVEFSGRNKPSVIT